MLRKFSLLELPQSYWRAALALPQPPHMSLAARTIGVV